jgi:hypothetical protein
MTQVCSLFMSKGSNFSIFLEDAKYMDFPAVLEFTKNKMAMILEQVPQTLKQCHEEAGV